MKYISVLLVITCFLFGCGATKRFSVGTVVEVDGQEYPINVDWEFHPEETKKAEGVPVFVAKENGKELQDSDGNLVKAYGLGQRSIELLTVIHDSSVSSLKEEGSKQPDIIRLKNIISKELGK